MGRSLPLKDFTDQEVADEILARPSLYKHLFPPPRTAQAWPFPLHDKPEGVCGRRVEPAYYPPPPPRAKSPADDFREIMDTIRPAVDAANALFASAKSEAAWKAFRSAEYVAAVSRLIEAVQSALLRNRAEGAVGESTWTGLRMAVENCEDAFTAAHIPEAAIGRAAVGVTPEGPTAPPPEDAPAEVPPVDAVVEGSSTASNYERFAEVVAKYRAVRVRIKRVAPDEHDFGLFELSDFGKKADWTAVVEKVFRFWTGRSETYLVLAHSVPGMEIRMAAEVETAEDEDRKLAWAKENVPWAKENEPR